MVGRVGWRVHYQNALTHAGAGCAHRNGYPQCLYLGCSTSPEGKSDSRSSWSRTSCGSGRKVGRNAGSSAAAARTGVPARSRLLSFFFFFSSERTEKVPMGSIKNVVSEPIEGHEDYHMMVTASDS